MPRHLTLLTGATRGLGAAMAAHLLGEPSNVVLCLSRAECGARRTGSRQRRDCRAVADLAAPLEAAARVGGLAEHTGRGSLRQRHADQQRGRADAVSVRSRASPATTCHARCASGLEAPLLLGAASLVADAGWRAERRLLNISSGLGRTPWPARPPIARSTPGFDHASRAMALDEALKPRGAESRWHRA